MENLTATTTAVIDLVTACMGLFEVYPLNIMLTAMLCGVAFKLFGKGRRATGASPA